MKISTTLKRSLAILLSFVVVYLLGSFVYASFNITEWSMLDRGTFAALAVVLSGLSLNFFTTHAE